MQVNAGDCIGPYEILASLGAGGMGEVYRARDPKLEREVALKILPADLASNPEALRRFIQEARAASALNHPSIVTVYDTGRDAGVNWIAMELIDGTDLRNMQMRPLPIKNALRIAVKIVDGLSAAHDKGIVHRDLKPENVMVTREGFVKILDFGLAKQPKPVTSDGTTMPHTSPGSVFGTVAYMAPEQAAGRDMDHRSDQFSFGLMLYEMLTGVRPFERATPPETMAAIIRDEYTPASAVNEAISPEIDRLISRCLAKEPGERYASTRDLARDLREIRDAFTTPSGRRHNTLPAVRRPRKTIAIAIVAAVAVVALAAGAWRMLNRSGTSPRFASIALAPFSDLTGSDDGRMIANGLSEMIASRLAEMSDLRVASPFGGAPIDEKDDVRETARRAGVEAVVRGSIERRGAAWHVSYSLFHGTTGKLSASGSVVKPSSDLFALEEAVTADLLRIIGREPLGVRRDAVSILGPVEQRHFVEAVALLQRVTDETSVDRAIGLLESILRSSRDSAPANVMLARALLYKASLSRRPALIEQAGVFAARGATLAPSDPLTHVTLGRLRNASGQHADALTSFERALVLRPNDADAAVGMATSLHNLGRAAEAEKMYRNAIALRPDGYGAFVEYGAFCFDHGRYEDAATNFRRAAVLAPAVPHVHTNLGAALQALGRDDEAVLAYEKSLALRPTAAGWSNLGTLHFYRGHFDDARKSYEKAVDLAPSDFVMWANLADAQRWSPALRERSVETYQRAIAIGREALAANPRDAATRASFASCLAKSGKIAEAQQEIGRALETDPNHPVVLYHAAVIALLRGSHDSARSWLDRAFSSGYPTGYARHDPELEQLRDHIESTHRKTT